VALVHDLPPVPQALQVEFNVKNPVVKQVAPHTAVVDAQAIQEV